MWIEKLQSDTEAASALSELTERVELSREGFRVSLKLPLIPPGTGSRAPTDYLSLKKLLPLQVKRRGVEMRMVLEGNSTPSRIDLPLLKAVARARRWSQDLIAGRVQSVDELAKRERLDGRSLRRLLQLGFLSPRIVEAIAAGHQPSDLTVIGLTRRIDLPLLWSAQEQVLGMR
jgi:site-specific DNA recombinase